MAEIVETEKGPSIEKVDPRITPALGVASGRGFLLFSHFFSFFFRVFPVLFPTFPNLKFRVSAEESTMFVLVIALFGGQLWSNFLSKIL